MDLDVAIAGAETRPAAYVLSGSRPNYLYKGSCRDLKKRIKDHRAGRVSRTKNIRPLQLVYFEYCADYTQARQRETFFKTGAGREFIAEQRADGT